MHGITEWLFLLAAGVIAGIIGTAGGITSLVSYPALLAAGVPALTANVTNSIALLGSGFGSAARAARDLDGHERTLRQWIPQTVTFAALGAVLLVVTPGELFARIVPFLVLAGSLTLLLQPRITALQARRGTRTSPLVIVTARAGIAVYNGYFGAGAGILLIALLLLTTEPVLHRTNSLKNVILLAADVLPAVIFAVAASVAWHALWPVAVGSLVGGLIGPSVARRVPASVLRVLIACCGIVLAVWLFVSHHM